MVKVCVSISCEDKDWIKLNGLSTSKLLQNAIIEKKKEYGTKTI